MSVLCPLPCPDYLRSAEMTEVMMSAPAMEEIGLSPRKDGLSYQRGYEPPQGGGNFPFLLPRLHSRIAELDHQKQRQTWFSENHFKLSFRVLLFTALLIPKDSSQSMIWRDLCKPAWLQTSSSVKQDTDLP